MCLSSGTVLHMHSLTACLLLFQRFCVYSTPDALFDPKPDLFFTILVARLKKKNLFLSLLVPVHWRHYDGHV